MATQPELIGDYKVIRELGRGAMGVVYLAVHPSLSRELAIKVMAPELARDPEFLERFRREGEAAAKLRHPNIVQVFDFAQRDGLYFIAMEYLGAATLKDLLSESGQLSVERSCAIMDDLLSALSLAHGKGIVHRDIKPANVMVTDEGSIALTDFSVAHMKESSKLTQTGAIVGTPEYMAPEQFDGVWDTRSDLYAAGIVFYELLTGLSPFRSATMTEVMRKQLLTVPDPPAAVDFTVPEAVSCVVSRSLEKEPEKRFQSASDMRYAIATALGHTPEKAPDPEPDLEKVLASGSRPEKAPVLSAPEKATPVLQAEAPAPMTPLRSVAVPSMATEEPPPPEPSLPTPLAESLTTPPAERVRRRSKRGARGVAVAFAVVGLSWGVSHGGLHRTPAAIPSATPSPRFTPAFFATPLPATPEPEVTPKIFSNARYPSEADVEPGVGVGEVKLGMSGDEIKEEWGKPASQTTTAGKALWTYGPPGGAECVLSFAKWQDKLEAIAFSTSTFTVEGEPYGHPGEKYQNILQAFGEPTTRDHVTLGYDNWGLLFRFDAAGLCNYIAIYAPGRMPSSL